MDVLSAWVQTPLLVIVFFFFSKRSFYFFLFLHNFFIFTLFLYILLYIFCFIKENSFNKNCPGFFRREAILDKQHFPFWLHQSIKVFGNGKSGWEMFFFKIVKESSDRRIEKWRPIYSKPSPLVRRSPRIDFVSCRFYIKFNLWASVQSGYQLPLKSKDYASEISGWRFRASPWGLACQWRQRPFYQIIEICNLKLRRSVFSLWDHILYWACVKGQVSEFPLN